MSIAYVTSVSNDSGGGSTLTQGLTVSGSNTILFVFIGNTANGNTDDTLGVVYNGISMTQIETSVASGRVDTPTGASNIFLTLWYLINPTAGSHNIVATRTGGGGDIYGWGLVGVLYSGARQFSQIDASSSGSGTGTTVTGTITTVADNAWAIMATTANVASTNSTFVANHFPSLNIFDTSGYGNITPAGLFSMTTTQVSQPYGYFMASFAPVLSFADIQGSADSIVSNIGLPITLTETVSEIDLVKSKYGFTDQTRHSSSWTDQTKH